jgi:hypothetical protein
MRLSRNIDLYRENKYRILGSHNALRRHLSRHKILDDQSISKLNDQ